VLGDENERVESTEPPFSCSSRSSFDGRDGAVTELSKVLDPAESTIELSLTIPLDLVDSGLGVEKVLVSLELMGRSALELRFDVPRWRLSVERGDALALAPTSSPRQRLESTSVRSRPLSWYAIWGDALPAGGWWL
jgi:hypothetical protein